MQEPQGHMQPEKQQQQVLHPPRGQWHRLTAPPVTK